MVDHHDIKLIYSAEDVRRSVDIERRRLRKAAFYAWAIAILLTVAIALSVRMQKFIEISWYWPAIIGVTTNIVCFSIGVHLFFRRN